MHQRIQVGQRREADPVEAALRDGRIHASSAPKWRAKLGRDPEGTRRMLARLYPGLRPGEGIEASASEAYPSEWLSPAERERARAFELPPEAVQELTRPASASHRSAEAGPSEYPREWLSAEERRRGSAPEPRVVHVND